MFILIFFVNIKHYNKCQINGESSLGRVYNGKKINTGEEKNVQ